MVEAILAQYEKPDKLVNYDLNLDKWDVVGLFKEAIWVQRLDEPTAYQMLSKGGIVLPNNNKVRGLYSPCKILMIGPDVKTAKVGSIVLISGAALVHDAMRVKEGFKTYFVREDMLVSEIEYNGPELEAFENIQDKVSSNLLK
jgi:hypothetical protein